MTFREELAERWKIAPVSQEAKDFWKFIANYYLVRCPIGLICAWIVLESWK